MIEFYKSNYIRILDTTLRDGLQQPSISLKPKYKIKVAEMLCSLGIDAIEYSPISSEVEKGICKKTRDFGVEVVGLARCVREDIDAAIDADCDTAHIYLGTSTIHMENKLRKTKEQVLKMVEDSVEYAKKHGLEVELSAEDGTRSDMGFLCEFFDIGVKYGVGRFNFPDTCGCAAPWEYEKMVSNLVHAYPEKIISVHCHNDLNQAVANSVAGVKAGARQVHTTLLGIGERAGNCPLESVVPAIEFWCPDLKMNIDSSRLVESCEKFAGMIGYEIPCNHSVIGRDIFRVKAGVHQDGMLKDPKNYLILEPRKFRRRIELVFDSTSGHKAIAHIIKENRLDADEGNVMKTRDWMKEKSAREGRLVSQQEILNFYKKQKEGDI